MNGFQPPIRSRCPSSTPNEGPRLVSPVFWRGLVERDAKLRACEFTGKSGEILADQGTPIEELCGFLILEGSLIELMRVSYENNGSAPSLKITRGPGDIASLSGLMGSKGLPMPYSVIVPNGTTARCAKLSWDQVFKGLFPKAVINAIREHHLARNGQRSAFRNEHLIPLMDQHIRRLTVELNALKTENARLLKERSHETPVHSNRGPKLTIQGVAPPSPNSAPGSSGQHPLGKARAS
jgi:hypothetical protein